MSFHDDHVDALIRRLRDDGWEECPPIVSSFGMSERKQEDWRLFYGSLLVHFETHHEAKPL